MGKLCIASACAVCLCGETKDVGQGTTVVCVANLKNVVFYHKVVSVFVVPELSFPIMLWNLIKAIEYNRSFLSEMYN